MLIQLNQVTKTIGGTLLFEELNLGVKTGEKIGLIGQNGSGKSTLLKIISGIEGVDEGTVSIRNEISLGYLSQGRLEEENISAKAYLMTGQQELLAQQEQLTKLERLMGTATPEELEKIFNRYSKLQSEFEEAGGYAFESQLEGIANGLGIGHLLEQTVTDLSGGEQTLLALGKILLENPDVFLLDEPTNHLDFRGIAWLENYIQKSKKTFIIVSHDRHFLNQVVNRIVELDYEVGYYPGNYDAYLNEKKKRQEILAKDYQEQQKEIKKIKDAIRRYRQWGHESDNEKFFKRAKHLEKRLEQMNEIARPQKEQAALLKQFSFSQRSGKEVLAFKEVTKGFDGKHLFEQATFNLRWLDKIGLLGGNGSGKSTLIKMILAQELPDSGEIKRGSQVEIGYLAQGIRYEHPKETVLNEFRRDSDLGEEESRRILAKYLFFKEDVFRQVGKLSGGEQVRLELAKLMQQPNNLLILDEPTNHLDITTRELLEDVLSRYQGTLLVVSHDRYFLKKVTNGYLQIENKEIMPAELTI